MQEDFPNTPWAKDCVAIFEKAIAEMNNKKETRLVSIAWGYSDRDEAELDRDIVDTFGKLHQKVRGLLSRADSFFEVTIRQQGDSNYPDLCRISMSLEKNISLTSYSGGWYDVLNCCEDAVRLESIRDYDDDDDDGDEFLLGVDTALACEGLSGRLLNDALLRLTMSIDELKSVFSGDGSE